jgi:cytochrome c
VTQPRIANSERRSRAHAGIEALEDRCLFAAFDVLVFSRTVAFRHDSISAGIATIRALGTANDFTVTATEDPNQFTDANLARYETVVFLLTTGDVLNAAQQSAFERFIAAGNGYVGVHSASDTEYGWAWYGGLVGAYFQGHPPGTAQATIKVADKVHPASAGLPERWVRTDEWYNFQTNPRGDVHVLATLDETTYSGGTMDFDHPITWVHEYGGGRSFYTGLGHTQGTYSEPLFRQHLLGGIRYAAGVTPAADAGATEDANFQKVVLEDDTLDPMQLDIAADGRVFFVERAGRVKMWNPSTDATTIIGTVPVVTTDEDGLLGIALDLGFAVNRWLYLFYSATPDTANEQRVSRFTLNPNGQLDLASERVLLRIAVQRGASFHSGGALQFGLDGLLYIAIGDNTSPFESDLYTPIDERPGRSDWDAQKSASNANDLRGKILRIRPQSDGTYSIPQGNLFPPGSGGRPEIYTMGNRNAFRFSVDGETGWLYWGEVGPDADLDNSLRGPRGYDEFNQARSAGNFGWPYFIADNKPYVDYNFATGASGAPFNPAAPVNNSPNNTGPQNLPPARGAWMWYPYGPSSTWPELGTGGRTAMAGPVYHFGRGAGSDRALPQYYDDTLFIYEWSRGWVKEVKLDAAGNVLKINPFAEGLTFKRPMDMKVGLDGRLYMIEWGTLFGGGNADSQVIRVDYLGRRAEAGVEGRRVFYNNSGFDGRSAAANAADDAAIATDKQALLPGAARGGFANVTSYNKGLNGVMIDVRGLPAGTRLSADDFLFKAGTSSDPSTWSAAPAPAAVAVRRGAGTGNSDRVTITWPDGAIRNRWLLVTVLPTVRTGTFTKDVFYFGNLAGETGDSTSALAVNARDVLANRAVVFSGAVSTTGRFDHDRNGVVNVADLRAVRSHLGRSITRLLPPALVPGAPLRQSDERAGEAGGLLT